MSLFYFGLVDIELVCLIVVVGKVFWVQVLFGVGFFGWVVLEILLWVFMGVVFGVVLGVGFVVGVVFGVFYCYVFVLLQGVVGVFGCVDWNMGEIGVVEMFELGIQVGKIVVLQQWIIGEINVGYDVLCVEGYLFGFGEKVVYVLVQYQVVYWCYWYFFFGNDFGGIEYVEIKFFGEFFVEDLQIQFLFWVVVGFDCVLYILVMEIWIGVVDFQCFVLDYGLYVLFGFLVKFYEGGFVFGVDYVEVVYVEVFYEVQ